MLLFPLENYSSQHHDNDDDEHDNGSEVAFVYMIRQLTSQINYRKQLLHLQSTWQLCPSENQFSSVVRMVSVSCHWLNVLLLYVCHTASAEKTLGKIQPNYVCCVPLRCGTVRLKESFSHINFGTHCSCICIKLHWDCDFNIIVIAHR